MKIIGKVESLWRYPVKSMRGENQFVGRSLCIGSKAVVAILERDPRCAMITLDPETGKSTPDLLRKVAQAHEGMAGVYGAVLVEGTLRKGDKVELLDSGVEAP